MKKPKQNKKSFLGNVINFFDKYLILPCSKLIYNIKEKLSLNNGIFERLLSKPNTLLYLSLILAFACFIGIDRKIINLVETEAIVISDNEISVVYNEEAYVIEGVPESADIILMGRTSDLYLAEQIAEHKLTLDLSKYGPGTHKVSLKYNNPINTLDYKLDPSSITVVVNPKISEARVISTDIINSEKLPDTLVISEVKLDRNEITVKSYKEKLEKIANVKALVDVDAINATSAGTYTLENVRLVAYDENGTEIKGIEVVPNSIKATITITSPSKELPIKVVPVGNVSSGSAISQIESSVSKVTVYGDEEALNNLSYIEVKIDVEGLNADKTYQKVIDKPTGVRSMSESTITITVKMQNEASKDFNDIHIEFQNLAEGLSAGAISESDVKVNVNVKGVTSLLENLNASDIKAYVDLTGLGEGTHSVPVQVTGSDLKLTYVSKTQKVNVVITKTQ